MFWAWVVLSIPCIAMFWLWRAAQIDLESKEYSPLQRIWIYRCTQDFVMPRYGIDLERERWIHVDAYEVEDLDTLGVLYHCPNCKTDFISR